MSESQTLLQLILDLNIQGHEGLKDLIDGIEKTEKEIRDFGASLGLGEAQIQGFVDQWSDAIQQWHTEMEDTEFEAIIEEVEAIKEGMIEAGEAIVTVSDVIEGATSAWETANAIFEVVAGTLGKVYDAAKEGAALEGVSDKIDMIAGSIGSTGDELTETVVAALDKTVTSSEAAVIAVEALGAGVFESASQLEYFMSLAFDIGVPLEQMTSALKDMDYSIFSQIGVGVDEAKDKVQEFVEAGHSLEDAFQLAFIEEANQALEDFGKVVGDSSKEIAQMEARWREFGENIKKYVMEGLMFIIDASNENADALDMLNQAYEDGLISQEEYGKAMLDMQFQAGAAGDVIEWLGPILENAGYQIEGMGIASSEASTDIELLGNATEEAGNDAAEAAQKFEDAKNKIDALGSVGMEMEGDESRSWVELEIAHYDTIKGAQELFMRNTEKMAEVYNSQLDSMTNYTDIFAGGITNIGGSVEDAAVDFFMAQAQAAADAGQDISTYIDIVGGIDQAYGEAMQHSAETTDFFNALNEAVAEGDITWEQAAAAITKVGDAYTVVGNATDIAMGAIWDLAETEKQGTEAQNAYNAAIEQGAVPVNALRSAMEGAGFSADQVQEALGRLIEAMMTGDEYGESIAKILEELGIAGKNAAEGLGEAQETMAAITGIEEMPEDFEVVPLEQIQQAAQNLEGIQTTADETGEALDEMQPEGEGIIDTKLFDNTIKDFDGLQKEVDETEKGLQKLEKAKPFEIMEDTLERAYDLIKDLQDTILELVDGSPYTIELQTVCSGQTASLSAGGGNVLAGQSYLVGEHGPELFVPYTHGEIIPNEHLDRYGSGKAPILITQNNNITNVDPLTAAMNQSFIDTGLITEVRMNL